MSAITVIRQRKAVHFLTDAAAYDESGKVSAFIPKTRILPGAAAGMYSVLGTSGLFLFLGEMFKEGAKLPVWSFDWLVENLQPIVTAAIHQERRVLGARGEDADWLSIGFQAVYLAGWSEARNRPDAVRFTYADDHAAAEFVEIAERQGEGVAQLNTVEALPMALTAQPAPSWSYLEERGWIPPHVEAMDPRTDGLLFIEAQRRFRFERPNGPAFFGVGGWCDLTTVDAEGVRQECLRRWDDRVSERIEPDVIRLRDRGNRRERRAAARDSRRRGAA